MTQTPNYDLNIVEGSDVVNPLVQTNPNFQTIDTVMKANEGRGIATATEIKSGTNHAITRNVANAVFRFVATSDFRTGDTFSIDGTTVTATLVDGTLPKDRAFVVGTSVLCILDGIRLTFVNCESSPSEINADDVNYDNSVSGLSATKVQGAVDELTTEVNNIKQIVNKGFVQVTGNGVKTYKQLLNELYSLMDTTKIGSTSYILEPTLNSVNRYESIVGWENVVGGYNFTRTCANESTVEITSFILHSTNSLFTRSINGTFIQISDEIAPNGYVFTLKY